MVSNPRCLISQIAVTFDEGDRGRCEERNRPSDRASGSASVFVCVFSSFADVYSTDPAVPSAPEQILF